MDRRQLDPQPIRTLGEHKVHVRLTMDLVPIVTVICPLERREPQFACLQVEAVEAGRSGRSSQAGAVVFQAAEPGTE